MPELEELAVTPPVIAVAIDCTEFCNWLKFDCRVLRSVCWFCNLPISFSTSCMGSDAIETARCNTCWKELAKVLWPVNVSDELLVPINDCLCKNGAEP